MGLYTNAKALNINASLCMPDNTLKYNSNNVKLALRCNYTRSTMSKSSCMIMIIYINSRKLL